MQEATIKSRAECFRDSGCMKSIRISHLEEMVGCCLMGLKQVLKAEQKAFSGSEKMKGDPVAVRIKEVLLTTNHGGVRRISFWWK
jgi:hypothetical protein